MTIIPDLHTIEQCEFPDIPPVLKKKWIPWATRSYRKYSFGNILSQEFCTAKLGFYHWHIQAEKKTCLFGVNEKPVHAMRFMLESDTIASRPRIGGQTNWHTGYSLTESPKGVEAICAEAGEHDIIQIEWCKPSSMDMIISAYAGEDAGEEAAEKIHNVLRLNIPHLVSGVNYVLRILLDNFARVSGKGAGLQAGIERNSCMILCEMVNDMPASLNEEPYGDADLQKKMKQIRTDILSFPHMQNHSSRRIAERYEIDLAELITGFQHLVHCSLASFVQFHVLKKAHYLITNSNVPLHTVILESGYSFTGHFNEAFIRQYGYVPDTLRENTKKVQSASHSSERLLLFSP